jgi:ribosomal protein L30E
MDITEVKINHFSVLSHSKMIYLSMNDPPEEKMNIQEYIQSYRIVVYEKDLLQIG